MWVAAPQLHQLNAAHNLLVLLDQTLGASAWPSAMGGHHWVCRSTRRSLSRSPVLVTCRLLLLAGATVQQKRYPLKNNVTYFYFEIWCFNFGQKLLMDLICPQLVLRKLYLVMILQVHVLIWSLRLYDAIINFISKIVKSIYWKNLLRFHNKPIFSKKILDYFDLSTRFWTYHHRLSLRLIP